MDPEDLCYQEIQQVLATLQSKLGKRTDTGSQNSVEILKYVTEIKKVLEAEGEEKDRPESAASREAFQVRNPQVQHQYNAGQPDFLYHLGLVVQPDRAPEVFGDVQYVCVAGTASRAQEFAAYCLDVLKVEIPVGFGMTDLCGGHARYVMYKAGPVLTVSHGMGNPSLSIMMHEVLKMLHYAKVKRRVTMIRIGTCGGIGADPGTTIISGKVYNGLFQNYYEQYVLGEAVRHPTILDQELRDELISHAAKPDMNIPVLVGNTLCADDFYEEQGRRDGAFCGYSAEQQMDFLGRCAHVYGIRNFEMESLAFSAMTHRAGVRAAVVCVALVNRLVADKVSTDVEIHMEEWQRRPQRLVAELIRHELAQKRATFAHQDQQLNVLRAHLERAAGGPTKVPRGKGPIAALQPGLDSVVPAQADSALESSSSSGESPTDDRARSPSLSSGAKVPGFTRPESDLTLDKVVIEPKVLESTVSADVVRK